MSPRRPNEAISLLQSILASSADAIISTNLTGTITAWNPAAERIFGVAHSDAVGQSIRLIEPPGFNPEGKSLVGSVLGGSRAAHREVLRHLRNGQLFDVSLTVSPLVGSDGSVVGASIIARELHDRQQDRRDTFRLAAIVESSDDAIIGKDLTGIVTTWNAAAETIFGYTAAEMIGQSIRRIIPGDRQQEEDEVLAKIGRGERVQHYETIRLRKDGALIPISLTVSPIHDEEGTIIGASKIARDIGERLHAEDERRRLFGIAQAASRFKDEFLATLSHELRTPLNTIVGYLRLMQEGHLRGEQHRRAIDTLVRNATSLTRLVEDVLDVSRIVSGNLRLNVQPVDLGEIIRNTVETTRPAADAKGIVFDVLVDPATGAVVGDPERLRQILWNLCSNAVKFTERGGHVVVRMGQVDSHVAITVSDTGIGISADFLPCVFDRFRQANAGIQRTHGGLGLGLAISRHLVESQGGRIFAESEGLGRGSTFRVELPVQGVQPAVSSTRPPHAPAAAKRMSTPPLQGTWVLAVDDDRDTLSLVRDILEGSGATVATAPTAQEALRLVERVTPDVLLADLGMPAMTGFELIERIRHFEDPRVRRLPAAALTARARADERANALAAGFDMHLAKPVDPEELVAAVTTLTRQGRNPPDPVAGGRPGQPG